MNYERSNSLADLAARIRAEHEAATQTLKDGLRHAIAVGKLLIEAKAQPQLKHGQWLPWLAEHCAISERSAQAYMRVARSLGRLEESKAQRVADLSYRDALRSLAVTGAIIKDLPPASYDRALQKIDDHDHAETFRQAVNRVRIEDGDARNERSLESQAMLPLPNGRRIRVARNKAERQWLLALGPGITRAALQERERLAREDDDVRSLQREHDKLIKRAEALDAEAKGLREEAKTVASEIAEQVRDILGPLQTFTETYNFQCEDEATDAELAALSDTEREGRLLAARGAARGPIRETERGYWGDMNLASQSDFLSGPGAWTRVGSPEWLDEVFPDWNKEEPQRQ
jgi:hypothetical protein